MTNPVDPNGSPAAAGEAALQRIVTDSAIRLGILGLLVYWSLTLIAPFITLVIWAVVLTVALYPVFAWLSRILGGREKLAAFLITVVMLIIVVGPVALLIAGLVEWLASLVQTMRNGSFTLPTLPEAIANLPMVGTRIAGFWQLATTNLAAALASIGPELVGAGRSVLGSLAGLGGSVLAFAASAIIAGVLFVPGPRLARAARRFATRVVAERGEGFIDMAGATIRNVSRGVIGVSLLQAILIGIGLMAAGVPAAGPLAIAALVLGIVQIGPGVVVIGVLIWSWSTQDPLTAGLLTAWLVPVTLVDNVLKPMVMAQGLRVPMLVILVGVLGGTLSYGLIGLFLGPIVLSVFYDLLVVWMESQPTHTDGTRTASKLDPGKRQERA